jgi:ATP-dependent RNA helicase DBP3
MGLSPELTEGAIKAAKKILKKQDDGSMKLKDLAKNVAEKLNDDSTTPRKVKKLLSKSDMFAVDGKTISLNHGNKRKETTDDAADAPASTNKKQKRDDDDAPPSDMDAWRKQHKIVLKDTVDDDSSALNTMEAYFPYTTFAAASATIPQSLLTHCTVKNGFTKPSPIQAQCWPVLLGGDSTKRDVVGIAETGSGKTLAFAMPALAQMSKDHPQSNTAKRRPRMLVLAPTRELAMQSHDVLEEFGKVVKLSSLVVYGGVPKYTQVAELKKGTVDCIVATPGRLKDLVDQGACDLSQVHHLVLDEAGTFMNE